MMREFYATVLIIAAIVMTPAVLAIIALMIVEPGTLWQRVRRLGGGD